MILSDGSLLKLLPQLIPNDAERDPMLVNPASVDIRVGRRVLREAPASHCQASPVGKPYFDALDLTTFSEEDPFWAGPGEFLLAETYERLCVPNGYAVELKLKSSRAREGWEHSLAFWFDPGWDGIGTMEIRNGTRYTDLALWCGLRFGQIIVHQLNHHALRPYTGRYNHATTVEAAKEEL